MILGNIVIMHPCVHKGVVLEKPVSCRLDSQVAVCAQSAIRFHNTRRIKRFQGKGTLQMICDSLLLNSFRLLSIDTK